MFFYEGSFMVIYFVDIVILFFFVLILFNVVGEFEFVIVMDSINGVGESICEFWEVYVECVIFEEEDVFRVDFVDGRDDVVVKGK